MNPATDPQRSRVLLLTPIGRDAALIANALSRESIQAERCPDADGLAAQIEAGAGALILAEEALTTDAIATISSTLSAQPAWSDLPVILLSTRGESTPEMAAALNRLGRLGGATVVERPVRPATLISIVKTALRSRRRQYQVETLLESLRVAEERLRTMVDSARDHAIVNLDLECRVTYWNAGAERLLGYREDEIVGRSLDIIFDDPAVFQNETRTALEKGRAESEGWRIRRDGSRFWGRGVVTTSRDSRGRIDGFVKVLRDESVRKHAEEHLAEQARALRQSNDDLQRFAYVASHDLQEPLRTIGSYTELLSRRNRDRLDEESRQYIEYVLSGVSRMRDLVRDLLDFSRVTGDHSRPPGPVDCNAVVGLALQHLHARIVEVGATVTVDPLPVVLGHESRVMQIFLNLIGNALKYCKTRPEVHVSAVRDGDFWRFAVRDNGIGIAPEHHDKIFGLFQRLHSRAEYSGTGIGLATSRRIIEQSGGRIWVESAEGAGSTFYFTLPAAEDQIASERSIGR